MVAVRVKNCPRAASLDGTVMEVVKQKFLYQGPMGTQGRNDVLCQEVLGDFQRRKLDLGEVKGEGIPGRRSCRREGPGVCWACVHVWKKTKLRRRGGWKSRLGMGQGCFECQTKECGFHLSPWLWVSGLTLSLSPWPLRGPEVIEKFDYVFAENGTVQYKHGRLLSKQVSPPASPPGSWDTFPQWNSPWVPSIMGGGAPCPPPSEPCVPCPDHPEPPGGRAPAGLDQLLPPLHGPP